jgi:hypothetical protein
MGLNASGLNFNGYQVTLTSDKQNIETIAYYENKNINFVSTNDQNYSKIVNYFNNNKNTLTNNQTFCLSMDQIQNI